MEIYKSKFQHINKKFLDESFKYILKSKNTNLAF